MKKGADVSLDEFLEEVRTKLVDFEVRWRRGRQAEPAGWPMRQLPGDWWEQFIMYDAAAAEKG